MSMKNESLVSGKKVVNKGVFIYLVVLVLIASSVCLYAKTRYSIEVINSSSSTWDIYQDDRYVIDLKPGQKWAVFVEEGKTTTLKATRYVNGVLQTLSDTFAGTKDWTWTIYDK